MDNTRRTLMRSISRCRCWIRFSRLRILSASFCCFSVSPLAAAYARQSTSSPGGRTGGREGAGLTLALKGAWKREHGRRREHEREESKGRESTKREQWTREHGRENLSPSRTSPSLKAPLIAFSSACTTCTAHLCRSILSPGTLCPSVKALRYPLHSAAHLRRGRTRPPPCPSSLHRSAQRPSGP